MAPMNNTTQNNAKRMAFTFVILIGIVILFAETTYEAARSINGQYLALLGATGTIVGVVAGLGELIGYNIRLVSGYLSDRTERYWLLTFLGYLVNLLAVPLLALAGSWEIAATLMIAERLGKGIRNPPRDAMLSHATTEIGRGIGFGIHEALDQIGAMLGPLIVAGILFLNGDYKTGYGILLIPAFLALAVLSFASIKYPHPRDLEKGALTVTDTHFPRVYWLYLSAILFVAAGFVDFPLIAFHFAQANVVSADWIPVFYAIAMGVDALAALVLGHYFDKIGVHTMTLAVFIAAFSTPLAFLGNFDFAFLGMVLWGVGMGAQESVMSAIIAEIIPATRRGSAYGIFNASYGTAWFLGSTFMGILYDVYIPALVVFSVLAQLIAVPLFFYFKKTSTTTTTTTSS